MGDILNAGFEQVLMLYNPSVYEVADIIDTFIYREGIQNLRFSYTTAVGMFKNIFGLIFVLTTNSIAKRLGSTGLF
jgi:putative aldouronate transport system permease protein